MGLLWGEGGEVLRGGGGVKEAANMGRRGTGGGRSFLSGGYEHVPVGAQWLLRDPTQSVVASTHVHAL